VDVAEHQNAGKISVAAAIFSFN